MGYTILFFLQKKFCARDGWKLSGTATDYATALVILPYLYAHG